MAKTKQVDVAVTVTLERDAYEKIQALIEGDAAPAQKIAGVCNGLLEDLAAGGMMLSGSDMERIRETLRDADAAAIIEAVEESSGMDEGQVVVRWRVDPTLTGPLQQIADQQGMTVDEVTQNLMDTACDQGWFYQFNPQPHAIFVDHADYVKIGAVIGNEQFTGADLMALLVKHGVIESEETLTDFLSGIDESAPATLVPVA
jgi:hypothetical protein